MEFKLKSLKISFQSWRVLVFLSNSKCVLQNFSTYRECGKPSVLVEKYCIELIKVIPFWERSTSQHFIASCHIAIFYLRWPKTCDGLTFKASFPHPPFLHEHTLKNRSQMLYTVTVNSIQSWSTDMSFPVLCQVPSQSFSVSKFHFTVHYLCNAVWSPFKKLDCAIHFFHLYKNLDSFSLIFYA